MRNISLIALLGTLSLLMGGCQGLPFFGGGDETAETPESPVVGSVPPEGVGTDPAAGQQQPFAPPPPEQATRDATIAAAPGLIASTDPDTRTGTIKKRQGDPFSVFPTRPIIRPQDGALANGGGGAGNGQQQRKAPGQAIREVPPLPPIPEPPRFLQPPSPLRVPSPPSVQGGGTAVAQGGNKGAGAQGGTAQGGKAGGATPSGPNFAPQLPKVPQPTLAQGVKVTGVIEVAGVPHAIVEAPGQKARYVKTGDYLANGQVLVKRIETQKGLDPIVVLEEKGIEVSRRVGEGGVATAPSESAPSPAASPEQQINRVSRQG